MPLKIETKDGTLTGSAILGQSGTESNELVTAHSVKLQDWSITTDAVFFLFFFTKDTLFCKERAPYPSIVDAVGIF